MNIPKAWHFSGPILVVLLIIWIYEYLGRPLEILFFGYWLGAIALEWAKYIRQAAIAYEMYLARAGGAQPIEQELVKEIKNETPGIFVPLVRSIQPIYAEIVEMPAFNHERIFAKDILEMYDLDPVTQKHVDLTEERWVVSTKRFSQKPFANMKKKWEQYDLLERANSNKNAKFIVKSRIAVALVASGNPLPAGDTPPLK
jgi:hypothetical protein